MSLDRRLSDAARHLAERVDPPEVDLGAVRAAARANHRRTVALTVAAATAAVTLAGIPLLAGGRDSTAPLPADRPTGEVVRALGDADCVADDCLEAGVYTMALGYADNGSALLSAEVRVDEGLWASNGMQHRFTMTNAQGSVMMNVYRPHLLASPSAPCADPVTPVAGEATAEEVAGQLARLPQFDVVAGPTVVREFARDTHYLELATPGLGCPESEGDQYNLADIYGATGKVPGGDSDIDPGHPVRLRFWVFDLGGRPIIVETREEGFPTDEMVARLDQLRATLHVEDNA